MKELKPDSQYWQLGSNATEVAAAMNVVNKIVKKHFGEKLLDTSYVVMNNRDGKPTVVTIQKEIRGQSLWQEVKDGDGDDAVRCNRVVLAYEDIWNKAFQDPDWQRLSPKVYSFFDGPNDIELKQIIHTPDNRYVLVDF